MCNLAGREFGRRQRDDVYRVGCVLDDDLCFSFPFPFYRVQQQHKASQIARLSVSARQNSPYQLAPSTLSPVASQPAAISKQQPARFRPTKQASDQHTAHIRVALFARFLDEFK